MPTMTSTVADGVRTVHDRTHEPVAVLGLGYVGLPTALALNDVGVAVIGIDASSARLEDIRVRDADLLPQDHRRLAAALEPPGFSLTAHTAALAEARTVLVCVPTPVDGCRRPDLTAVGAASATVIERATPGKAIVLTSTKSVGTTLDLLADRRERGAEVAHHDPLVGELDNGLSSVPEPGAGRWDLVVMRTLHPDSDAGSLDDCLLVLDTTHHVR